MKSNSDQILWFYAVGEKPKVLVCEMIGNDIRWLINIPNRGDYWFSNLPKNIELDHSNTKMIKRESTFDI